MLARFPKQIDVELMTLIMKSPNEFALKAGIKWLYEIRLSDGEAQESGSVRVMGVGL